MQIAKHLQEWREHPHTEATAQNTHQMEETINLSNIYKMQMRIKKWCCCPRTPVSLPAYRALVYHLSSRTPPLFLNASRPVSLPRVCLLTNSPACWIAILWAIQSCPNKQACFLFAFVLPPTYFIYLPAPSFIHPSVKTNLFSSHPAPTISKFRTWLVANMLMAACLSDSMLVWSVIQIWGADHQIISFLF